MRFVLVLSSFLFLLPAVGAASPPAQDPTGDIVDSHSIYDPSTRTGCWSTDPVTGIASTDLTSRFSGVPDGAGTTTFTLHLDATLPDLVNGAPACGAVDLVFTSALAWPALPNQWSSASFASPCGLAGSVAAYRSATETFVELYFGAVPTGCALPISQGQIAWSMSGLHPQTAAVCTPLVFPGCFGAYSESFPGYGCQGGDLTRFNVAAGITLLLVERGCNWQDRQEHVVVSDGLGLVRVDTTSHSCDLVVADPTGIVGDADAPCPAQVGDAIYGTDWGHVLP